MTTLSSVASKYELEMTNPTTCCIFPHYTYLSFRKKIGWELVHLNCIQEFARKYFGFYKSTDLRALINGCHRTKLRQYEDDAKYLPALEKQLHDLWLSRMGTQAPYPTYSVAFSNAPSIGQASIIAFGERHTEKTYDIFIGRMLQRYYRPGDIILIEGIKAGEVVTEPTPLTSFLRYADLQNPRIQGWEPPNTEEAMEKLFAPTIKYAESFQKKIENLSKELPDRDNFIDNELDQLQTKVHTLINQVMPPLFSNQELRNKETRSLNIKVKILFKGIKKAVNPVKFAKLVLVIISYFIIEIIEKRKYTLTSDSGFASVLKMHERDDSLAQEIEKATFPGRHVFVIAGASHLLNLNTPSKKKVADTIQRHAYAIFAARNSYEKSYKDLTLPYRPFTSTEVL